MDWSNNQKKLFWFHYRIISNTTYLLLILTTLSIFALHSANYFLENYHHDIEEWLSESLNAEVKFGHLSTKWKGRYYAIEVDDLTYSDQSDSQLKVTLEQLNIDINMLSLLLPFYHSPGMIKLHNGVVSQTDTHSSTLPLDQSNYLPFYAWLSNQQFDLKSIHYTNQSSKQHNQYHLKKLTFSHLKNRHQLLIEGFFFGLKEDTFFISADFHGKPEYSHTWTGQIYSQIKTSHLEQLLSNFPEKSLSKNIKNKKIVVEFWGDWKKHLPTHFGGRLNNGHLVVSTPINNSLKKLSQLDGQVFWKRVKQHTILGVDKLKVILNKSHLDFKKVELKIDKNGTLNATNILFPTIPINEMLTVLFQIPGEHQHYKKIIEKTKPKGFIHELTINYSNNQWQFKGKLNKFSSSNWQQYPQIDILNIDFKGNEKKGMLSLPKQPMKIFPHQYFIKPLQFTEINGDINWNIDNNHWSLSSKSLAVASKELKSNHQFKLKFYNNKNSPDVEYSSHFSHQNNTQIKYLLPSKTMDSDFINWFNTAFLKGKINQGSCRLTGKLDQFPFKNGGGNFIAKLYLNNTRLLFDSAWPPLNISKANIIFKNQSVQINLKKSHLLKTQINQASLLIDDLDNIPSLNIAGDINSRWKNTSKLIQQSPLQEQFEEITNAIELKGHHQLKLNLQIPMQKTGKLAYQGELQFNKNHIISKTNPISISNVQGKIFFNENNIKAKSLNGIFYDEKIQLNLTQSRKQQIDTLKITAKTNLNLNHKTFKPWINLKNIHGKTPFRLEASLHKDLKKKSNNRKINFIIKSETKGITINYPAPFRKRSDKTKQLIIMGEVKPKQTTKINWMLGQQFKGDVNLDYINQQWNFSNGLIMLGDVADKEPGEQGLFIHAKLKTINTKQWLPYLKDFNTSNTPTNNNDFIRQINVDVKKLKFNTQEFNHLKILARQLNNNWDINLKSNEASGALSYVGESRQLNIILNHLLAKKIEHKPETKQSNLNLNELPSLKLSIKRFNYNGHDFGRVEAIGKPHKNGYFFEKINLKDNENEINAMAKLSMSGNLHHTIINPSWKSKNPGNFLQKLGYETGLENKELAANGEFQWRDRIDRFNLKTLEGEFETKLGKGIINEIDPGLGRAIGLLSFDSLQRRMTLDFSDLYKTGFVLDNAYASFKIAKGEALIKEFYINSPSARIDMYGLTELTKKQYQQKVLVTPKISATLPLITALAAGPQAGAVLLILQKFFGKKIDQITQHEYSIAGNWDNPVITKTKTVKSPIQSVMDSINILNLFKTDENKKAKKMIRKR